MHHFFVHADQVRENQIVLEGDDVNHIRNVLRMREGDEFTVSTGQDGIEYRCMLKELTPGQVTGQVMWKSETGAELPCRVTLYQGLPKSDKMEWIIQKMVELGAAEIVPVAMRRCVMKLEGGKEKNKITRWNAIAKSAAEQSKRLVIPPVQSVMRFSDAVKDAAARYDLCLVPYELEGGMEHTRQILDGICPGQSVAIFIGPEGGFDPDEIELARKSGAQTISLGRRILRTETAGIAIMAALMLKLEP